MSDGYGHGYIKRDRGEHEVNAPEAARNMAIAYRGRRGSMDVGAVRG